MTTKWYFHDATTSDTGTLPTTIQSALGAAAVTVDAATVNRSMDQSIGAAQVDKTITSLAQSTAQKIYITRFVSSPINGTNIAAGNWNYAFAAKEDVATANFPCNGTSQPVNVTVFIWRPSNGTKIATVFDGNSDSNFGEPGNATIEKSVFGTFQGNAVSFAVNDILCTEIYFTITQGNTVAHTDDFFYDGTTETNNNNTTVSNHASYIEGPPVTTGGATVNKPTYFPASMGGRYRPMGMTGLGNRPPIFG